MGRLKLIGALSRLALGEVSDDVIAMHGIALVDVDLGLGRRRTGKGRKSQSNTDQSRTDGAKEGNIDCEACHLSDLLDWRTRDSMKQIWPRGRQKGNIEFLSIQ